MEFSRSYEVDVDIFLKQLDNRESWIYKVLEENVYHSLDYAPIDYRHATFAVKDNDNYKCRFDMLNAEEKEIVGKALTDRAVVEIKDDIKRLGDDPKVYFITFCTDDGEGEGFDDL